jgi:hypothetical protein
MKMFFIKRFETIYPKPQWYKDIEYKKSNRRIYIVVLTPFRIFLIVSIGITIFLLCHYLFGIVL